jgi:hypothetical protein
MVGELWLYSFFHLGARWGGWSTPRRWRFTPGKDTRYRVYRMLGGPRAGLVGWAENLASHRDSIPDRQARSERPYTSHKFGYKPIMRPCTLMFLWNVTNSMEGWKSPFESLTGCLPVKKIQPGGSLPRSQSPITCHYSEPYQSSPCPNRDCLKVHQDIRSELSYGYPTTTPHVRFSSSHMCYVLPISFFLILSPNNICWLVQAVRLLVMWPVECTLIIIPVVIVVTSGIVLLHGTVPLNCPSGGMT